MFLTRSASAPSPSSPFLSCGSNSLTHGGGYPRVGEPLTVEEEYEAIENGQG
jgi:hypothetical protein